MTAYLQSKNRSVRFARLRERMFEVFISHVEVLFPCITVLIYMLLIIAIIMGVADYASIDMSLPMRQSLP
jgi:hypothetical protein